MSDESIRDLTSSATIQPRQLETPALFAFSACHAARAEGVFVGPVYTENGVAGMLDHARSGRIPTSSNVAFLHTGDTGNLFEIPKVVGAIAD